MPQFPELRPALHIRCRASPLRPRHAGRQRRSGMDLLAQLIGDGFYVLSIAHDSRSYKNKKFCSVMLVVGGTEQETDSGYLIEIRNPRFLLCGVVPDETPKRDGLSVFHRNRTGDHSLL